MMAQVALILAASGCSFLRCGHSAGPASHLPPVAMPGGSGGIGFDDLVFARGIRRVLVPAGGTGNLDLIDPDTHSVTQIAGFSKGTASGHDVGTTSADEGKAVLFASDRTARRLLVVDPAMMSVVASAGLDATPDYVRFVAATNQVWVTEPAAEQIEVFSAAGGGAPARIGTVHVAGGPESLVIDSTRKLAYTHLWNGATVAIDLQTLARTAQWPNGCNGSRGIALDEARGFLFAGCDEGKATVLDVNHGGAIVSTLAAGAGVDVIAYNPTLAHLYVPGADSATLSVMAVSPAGQLSLVGTAVTASGAHCVAADDRGNAWVCDPDRGQLLLFSDNPSK